MAPDRLLFTEVLRTQRTLRRTRQGATSNRIGPTALANLRRELFGPHYVTTQVIEDSNMGLNPLRGVWEHWDM